jgi:hypothetical protein
MSKFQEGDTVRVNAEGKEYHGAMGIVKIPHIQCTDDPVNLVGVVLDMDAYSGVARWFAEDDLLLGHRKTTKSLGMSYLTPKEKDLSVKDVPRTKFEGLVSKPILNPEDTKAFDKLISVDLEHFEKRLCAALGVKKELLKVDRDHFEKQEAVAHGFEKPNPEVQKRSAAEKLARFAESYGMSKETFKKEVFGDGSEFTVKIPGDAARRAAMKIRLREMKDILDRGLRIPKEHMAEYKFLVDAVGEEYRLDMEGKLADIRIQRAAEMTKNLGMNMNIFPKLSFDVVEWDRDISKPALKETWSATIVLASGREVSIPDPNPEKWELVETKKDLPIKKILITPLSGINQPGNEGKVYPVVHEAGRCWIKDMARIVSQTERVSPFEERFSYLVELRHFKEKAVVENSYTNALPTLSVLW